MTDLPDNMVQLRLLVSARNSGQLFDLRCDVREAIVRWLIREYPEALPRQRNELLGQKAEVQTETMRKQAVLF
jgi:hypothetical protein